MVSELVFESGIVCLRLRFSFEAFEVVFDCSFGYEILREYGGLNIPVFATLETLFVYVFHSIGSVGF